MDRRQVIESAKQMTLEQKKTAFASEYEANTPTEMGVKSERACKCIDKMQQQTTSAIKKYIAGDKDALSKAHLFLG
jgi:hypothetical protein